MKNTINEFLIANKAKKFASDMYLLLENIPRKDFNIKEKINDTSLELIKNIMRANYAPNKFDIYAVEINTNIATLNFLLEVIYKRKYISLTQFEKQIFLLTQITKMVTVWLRNKKSC